jgi:hypothetical protein
MGRKTAKTDRGGVARSHLLSICGMCACLAVVPLHAGGAEADLSTPPQTSQSVTAAARGSVSAGEEAPALETRPTFYKGELLPRLSYRLDRHRDRVQPRIAPGEEWLEHLVWEQASADVQRDVERATRKALRDHLLENTKLSHVVASIERRARGGRDGGATAAAAPGTGPARERRIDWDLGFHSAIPEVEMRYRLPRGDVRLDVGLDGDVGLRYRHAAMGSTEVSADYDSDDETYRLLAIVRF